MLPSASLRPRSFDLLCLFPALLLHTVRETPRICSRIWRRNLKVLKESCSFFLNQESTIQNRGRGRGGFVFWAEMTGNNSPEQVQHGMSKKQETGNMIKSNISANSDGENKLPIEEVNMTIEKLILLEETLNSSEIASLFSEEEVSLEEVKEAFRLFDENNDGFIDTDELRNVLSKLNFAQASEDECKRMICAFDDDRDGRIDFNEFVKLLESSFS